MPADTMTPEELAAFPDYSSARKKEYLYIRNAILRVWEQNPGQGVTLETAAKSIQKPEYQNKAGFGRLLFLVPQLIKIRLAGE